MCYSYTIQAQLIWDAVTRSKFNKISSDTCMKTARLLPTFHHHWNAWRASSQKRCFVSKIIYLYLNTLYFFHRFAEKFYNKFCWKNFVQIVHIFFSSVYDLFLYTIISIWDSNDAITVLYDLSWTSFDVLSAYVKQEEYENNCRCYWENDIFKLGYVPFFEFKRLEPNIRSKLTHLGVLTGFAKLSSLFEEI